MSTELFPSRADVERAIYRVGIPLRMSPNDWWEGVEESIGTLLKASRAYLLMLPVNEANKGTIERLEKQVEELKDLVSVGGLYCACGVGVFTHDGHKEECFMARRKKALCS